MRVERIDFEGQWETILPGIMWLPDEEPKAILQVTHGMTEHIGRYEKLAEAMTAQGIAVAGFDLRGHGENAGDPEVASLGEKGWDKSLDDMHAFYQCLDEAFPGIPHFMLGFSLGSFLLRDYMGFYDTDMAGAIIMGTGQQSPDAVALAAMAAKKPIKKLGWDATTPKIHKLAFETYNKKFAPNRTEFDWLCADEAELDKFIQDPLSRSDISAGTFLFLLGAMKRATKKGAYDKWNKDIPILLLSGAEDPVGDSGRGVARVKNALEKAGQKDVTLYLIKEARHDLLHEEASGAAEMAREILTEWINECLNS